jgi:CRISPR-associated endonuclease/helicase Cas3
MTRDVSSRIIVVIPYTSIIEQTARVFRDELFEQAFGPDYVLEHHSAVAPREREEDRGRDAENERLRRARLAAENWASPLIVTTNVQFFESLFSNRPSDCRKLHNIGRSVVLFDEVQTLPPRLVPSLLSAVRLLTRDYGVTAIFMTATQPAFAAAGSALPYDWQPVEISSNPAAMAETLKRTRIELPAPNATLAWSELAQRPHDGNSIPLRGEHHQGRPRTVPLGDGNQARRRVSPVCPHVSGASAGKAGGNSPPP